MNIPDKFADFGNFWQVFANLQPIIGPPVVRYSYSSRGSSRLQFEWSYIKIGQELPSEIKKI